MENTAQTLQTGGPRPCSGFDLNTFMARVQAVLFDPKGTWTVIKAEQLSVKEFYTKYFLALAAIPAVCGFFGMWFFGFRIPVIGGTFRPPFFSNLYQHALSFGLMLVAVYIMALILEFLAPKFGGATSTISALKLAGFSMVPSSVAGFLQIYPSAFLGFIGILISLYSIYVFWLGVPEMTSVPAEKKLPYVAVSAVCCIAASFVLGAIVFGVVGPNLHTGAPTITTGEGNLDLNKLEEQMKQIQKMLPQTNN